MKDVVKQLIQRKEPRTAEQYDLALREAIQLIALLGLWRAKFFEHAAFYGGTALRLVHELPRFSEDVDFSLLQKQEDFALDRYISALQRELASYGFESEVTVSSRGSGPVESAFIKANSREHIIAVEAASSVADLVPRNQVLKVKLEVDTDPPPGFHTEALPVLDPIPFQLRVYALPDLFAGKMHCVLCRGWQGRVKGRDWYDMIWFLRNETPLHLEHLEQRMRQSGHWDEEKPLDAGAFRNLYLARAQEVDFGQAASDVRPFIADPSEVEAWSSTFFGALVSRFRFV